MGYGRKKHVWSTYLSSQLGRYLYDFIYTYGHSTKIQIDINWNEIFLFSISRDICSIDFWEYTNCIVAVLETLT